MLEALCDHLLDKPDLYLHEMELFFLDEFEVSVPKSTISDALHRKRWSTQIYVMITVTSSQNSALTILFTWTNLGVING